MKPETILDAMEKALHYSYENKYYHDRKNWNIRKRQYHAFRERILRMDAEKDKIIGRIAIELHHKDAELWNKDQRIAELETEFRATTEVAKALFEQRDRRIVGLENRIAELEVVKELLIKENNDVHDCLKEANKRIAELEEKLEETLVRLAKLKIRGVE